VRLELRRAGHRLGETTRKMVQRRIRDESTIEASHMSVETLETMSRGTVRRGVVAEGGRAVVDTVGTGLAGETDSLCADNDTLTRKKTVRLMRNAIDTGTWIYM
jgi:hypothetical protein